MASPPPCTCRPPMVMLRSARSPARSLIFCSSVTRSGLPGAYALTGSFPGTGTFVTASMADLLASPTSVAATPWCHDRPNLTLLVREAGSPAGLPHGRRRPEALTHRRQGCPVSAGPVILTVGPQRDRQLE